MTQLEQAPSLSPPFPGSTSDKLMSGENHPIASYEVVTFHKFDRHLHCHRHRRPFGLDKRHMLHHFDDVLKFFKYFGDLRTIFTCVSLPYISFNLVN